jgi:hypothetical protein
MDKEIGMDTQTYFRPFNASAPLLLKLKALLVGMVHPCGARGVDLEIPGAALIEHVLRVDIVSYPAECSCDRCENQVSARGDVFAVIALLEGISEQEEVQVFCSLKCTEGFADDGQLFIGEVLENE